MSSTKVRSSKEARNPRGTRLRSLGGLMDEPKLVELLHWLCYFPFWVRVRVRVRATIKTRTRVRELG